MACSVLIVDDDARFRETFAEALRGAAGLRLAGMASDLADGRRLLDTLVPDVLLVDLGLPGGNGIELIRHAHEHLPQRVKSLIEYLEQELPLEIHRLDLNER